MNSEKERIASVGEEEAMASEVEEDVISGDLGRFSSGDVDEGKDDGDGAKTVNDADEDEQFLRREELDDNDENEYNDENDDDDADDEEEEESGEAAVATGERKRKRLAAASSNLQSEDIHSDSQTSDATTDAPPPPPQQKSSFILQMPLSRVKTLMKFDPDVTLASQEAVSLVALATQLFVDAIAKDAAQVTLQGKKKTMQRRDVDAAVDGDPRYAFLEGMIDF